MEQDLIRERYDLCQCVSVLNVHCVNALEGLLYKTCKHLSGTALDESIIAVLAEICKLRGEFYRRYDMQRQSFGHIVDAVKNCARNVGKHSYLGSFEGDLLRCGLELVSCTLHEL